MSTTNLNLILINLFFSSQLPIKQPIKVDQNNISTPKTGIPDLVVTHYDCSPKHITNMQYYKLNKIVECKIKPADFKITTATNNRTNFMTVLWFSPKYNTSSTNTYTSSSNYLTIQTLHNFPLNQ